MFFYKNNLFNKSSAFSLIELLVSVAIILLLVGGAVAGYTRYIERQRLIAAAEKIQSGFREAQNIVRVGYLGSCEQLNYSDFSLYVHDTNGLTYEARIHCQEDLVDFYRPENTTIVTLGVDFLLDLSLWSLRFYPYGNLNNSVSRILYSTRSSYYAVFEIDQGGGIKVSYH